MRSTIVTLFVLSTSALAGAAFADTTPQSLPFTQDWSNAGLITADDNWNGVPGIIGYRGDSPTASPGTDPQTILQDLASTPVNVIADRTSPSSEAAGGVAEFQTGPFFSNNTIALQGSTTADFPNIVLSLDTRGFRTINIAYNVRDIDNGPDNTNQQVALQFRVGTTGNFTNLPGGYIPDATTGPGLATRVTPINVTLPAAADNQAVVQIRILTSDAPLVDEWVGIDDISITAASVPRGIGAANPSPVFVGLTTLLTVAVTPASGPPSTGLAVSGNLTAIGGSASQQFFDDGSNGDVTAGDNTFSFLATVAVATPAGAKSLPFTITDAESRTGTGTIAVTVAVPTCGDGATEGLEQCDGGSCCTASCTFVATGTECRAAAGSCDIAETCDGASAACPADVVEAPTTLCRASAGACDIEETCDGVSAACPADAVAPPVTLCRAAAGGCDVAETCDGVSTACPIDLVAPPATVCRAVAGACDIAESCDGASAACPADAFEPGTTVCRGSAGACDIAESCSGASAACPTDALEPPTTVCRGAAGVCDQAESCTGASVACPADVVAPAVTVCRPQAGGCDITETCDGVGIDCPSDSISPIDTVCRAGAGVCDVAESCDGASAACPTDAFQPGTLMCRASAGPCDLAESCTGASAACPNNTFEPSTTVCRATAGPCDLAEACTGVSAACPLDSVEPATTVCRPSIDICDPEESCTGTAVNCPLDGKLPDATSCDDGDICTQGATCLSGVCQGGIAAISVDPTTLEFPETTVDLQADPLTITLTNNSTDDLNIQEISNLDGTTFPLMNNPAPVLVPAGGSVTIDIGFAPKDGAAYSDTLKVVVDGCNDIEIELSGNGKSTGGSDGGPTDGGPLPPDDGGCCRTGQSGASSFSLLLALGTLILISRRRRRR